MIKRTINGEDFYFNLTTAELTKMQLTYPGGLREHFQRIINSEDGGEIITGFEMILRAGYGRKQSTTGKFLKHKDWFDEITATEEYSELFMKLVTNAEFSAEFINGLLPADLMAKAEHNAKQDPTGLTRPVDEVRIPEAPDRLSDEEMLAALGANEPAVKDYSNYTNEQLRKLPRHELVEAYRQKNAK